jgi:hypothetical protein
VDKKRGMHPNDWALFLVDDDLNHWMEWGHKGKTGEDGICHWELPSHPSLIVPSDLEFRTEICKTAFWSNPFDNSRETFRVYRAHVGDMQAWSWGSMPGKRLDESVISHFVNGRYAEKELAHLEQDGQPMDMKKMILIGGALLVVAGAFYFFVMPMLKTKKAVVTDNKTAVVTPAPAQSSSSGYWAFTSDNRAVWVVP